MSLSLFFCCQQPGLCFDCQLGISPIPDNNSPNLVGLTDRYELRPRQSFICQLSMVQKIMTALHLQKMKQACKNPCHFVLVVACWLGILPMPGNNCRHCPCSIVHKLLMFNCPRPSCPSSSLSCSIVILVLLHCCPAAMIVITRDSPGD
jgi:hypothetical protein